MNTYLSRKLSTLSFLLMVLIVFIHGFNVNISFGDKTSGGSAYWIQFLESFMSDGFCRVAVPMFFAISGYLASLNFADGFSMAKYLIMIRKRVKTLLIPYLVVSFLGICFVVLLQQIPFSSAFSSPRFRFEYHDYRNGRISSAECVRRGRSRREDGRRCAREAIPRDGQPRARYRPRRARLCRRCSAPQQMECG